MTTTETETPVVHVRDEPTTYGPRSMHSLLVDVARARALRDEDAIHRLERHCTETRTNPNNVLGTGGEFAPPGYMIDHFVTAAKVGRHFAELVGSNPMPRGVSQINIPRFIGTDILGQDTAIQVANADPIAQNDPTSAYNTSQVVSITGNLIVSQQLYDQTPNPGFDTIGTFELVKDYNAVLNGQMVNGTGANGQLTGLANFAFLTANDVSGTTVGTTLSGASSMISTLWTLMGQAAANVGNNRGHRPDFWLMAPRRWFAIAGSLDQQSRPIMSPSAQQPYSGEDTPMSAGPHAVSNIHGIPVYTDGAIPVTTYTAGSPGTIGALADSIYCGRIADTYLFESDPMIQASVNATAGTLQVRLSLHRYAAFVGNLYTSAYGRVKNIPQPTNY